MVEWNVGKALCVSMRGHDKIKVGLYESPYIDNISHLW